MSTTAGDNNARCTLIAFIGRGQFPRVDDKLDTSQYLLTRYRINGVLTPPCANFSRAFIESKSHVLQEIIILGTANSAWSGVYTDTPNPAADDKNYSPDELEHIAAERSHAWGIPTACHSFAADLNNETAEKIFNQFIRLALQAGRKILLDITHCFRWVPIFMIAALKLKEVFPNCLENITIIYGEIDNSQKTAPGEPTIGVMRQLNTMWEGIETSRAIALFLEKFDARQLALQVAPYWPAGAEIITQLAKYFQENFLLPLAFEKQNLDHPGTIIVELQQKLAAIPQADAPAWIPRLKTILAKEFLEPLNSPDTASRRLLAIGQMLFDRNLPNQAIMALCMAWEVFCCELNHCIAYPEDATVLEYSYKSKRNLKKSYRHKINALLQYRNITAHGGLRADFQGQPNIYERYQDFYDVLDNIFQNPDKCFKDSPPVARPAVIIPWENFDSPAALAELLKEIDYAQVALVTTSYGKKYLDENYKNEFNSVNAIQYPDLSVPGATVEFADKVRNVLREAKKTPDRMLEIRLPYGNNTVNALTVLEALPLADSQLVVKQYPAPAAENGQIIELPLTALAELLGVPTAADSEQN